MVILLGIYGALLPSPAKYGYGGYPLAPLAPIILIGLLAFLKGPKAYIYYFVTAASLFHFQLAFLNVLQLGGLNVRAYDFFTLFSTILLIGRLPLLKKWRHNKIYRALLLFALVCLFGIGYGFVQHGPRAIAGARQMPLKMIPAFLLLTVLAEDRLFFFRLMKWLFFIALVISGQIILQALLNMALPDSYILGREWIRFSGASTLMFLGITLIILVYFATFKSQQILSSRKTIAGIVIIAFAIMLGQARSVWISVMVVFPILFLLAGGKVRIGRFIILCASSILVMIIGLAAIEWVSPKIYSSILLSSNIDLVYLEESTPLSQTLIWRLTAWQQIWMEAIRRPVLGYGWGKLLGYYTLSGEFEMLPAHNAYLEIFYTQGAVGLIAFVVLNLKVLFHLARNRYKEYNYLTISLLLAAISHVLFNIPYGTTYWYFLIIALGIYVTAYAPMLTQTASNRLQYSR